MEREKLRSVEVTPTNESLFYDFIKDNFVDFFFFHVDYAQYPGDTKIYIALDIYNKVKGVVLIWKNQRLQLRGTNESLEFLLNQQNYTPISVTGFEEHRQLIATFFPEYNKEIALYRMGLKKGEQKDFEKYSYQVLNEAHKEEIVSLMRITDPIYWGTRNSEDILIDDNNKWFGIFEKERLIAITGLWNYQRVGYITVVGTHPDYWNRGLASSLISSVLKKVFQDKEEALITVRIENKPAVHTYKKIGFSINNTHYSYERE